MKTIHFLLFLPLFALLGSPQNVVAQDPDISWGSPIRENRITRLEEVAGVYQGQTFAVLHEGNGKTNNHRGYRLVRLDAELEVEAEHELSLQTDRNNLIYQWSILLKGRLFVFASTQRNGERQFSLYVREHDLQSLEPKGEFRMIQSYVYGSSFNPDWYRYDLSRDSSKMLTVGNLSVQRKENTRLDIRVSSDELGMVWRDVVEIPYPEQRFSVKDLMVDNDGNVYIVGVKTADKLGDRISATKRQTYHILALFDNGERMVEYTVDLRQTQEKIITDLKLTIAPGGDLVCAGFYSTLGLTTVRGTYYLRIDAATKEVTSSGSMDFDIGFITQYYSRGKARKAHRREARGKTQELFSYDLRDLIPRGDGGAVLLAEQYHVYTSSNFNGPSSMPVTTVHYKYNFVLVVSISPEGEVEWATKIPKIQHSTNDDGYYSSFVHMVTGDALYLIYNDHVRNLAQPDMREVKYNFSVRERTGAVAIVEIDTEGEWERRELFPNDQLATILVPKACSQLSASQVLLFAKRRKELQFGKLKF